MAILRHAIVCILIYFVFGRDKIAFWTSILFALNPANNQVAVWLSGFGYSMGTIFTLLMFLFKPIAIIFYAVACYYSINSLPAPLIFLQIPHQKGKVLYLLVLVFIFKKFKQIISTKQATATKEMKTLHFKKLILFVKTYSYYFCLCLFPVRLGLYHTFGYSFGLTKEDSEKVYKKDLHFWLGLILCGLIGYVIFSQWGTPVSFGLWWFSVFIFPWCNLITIQQFIAERYIYLANIGLMYALVSSLMGK